MKLLIVFRGGYLRSVPEQVSKNVQEKIYAPLDSANIQYDAVFYTYSTDMAVLGKWKECLGAKTIYITEQGPNQILNFKQAIEHIARVHTDYDYVVFLRFDIIYKVDILQWNLFGRSGLFFPYKENCPENCINFLYYNLYSDIILCVSKEYLLRTSDAVNSATDAEFPNESTLHNLATILRNRDMNVPILTLIDGFYQSNTSIEANDPRMSPLFIMTHVKYNGPDRDMYEQFLCK